MVIHFFIIIFIESAHLDELIMRNIWENKIDSFPPIWTWSLIVNPLFREFLIRSLALIVRCQTKVHNCKYSYLLWCFIVLLSKILLLIEFCFTISLIFLIFSPCPKYTSLGVRLSNDSWNLLSPSFLSFWITLISFQYNISIVIQHKLHSKSGAFAM